MRAWFWLILLTTSAGAGTLAARITCAPIFGDHMVLQRDKPVLLWGDGAPGEQVTVEFAGQRATTTVGNDRRWSARLTPLPASTEPRTLIVRGENVVEFKDVLVGEVWFCSGQSNMEKQLGPRKGQKPVDRFEEELARSHCPTLRLFQGEHARKTKPEDVVLQWRPCGPEALNAMEFSAAAYFFGRELVQELGVPVGLIHSSFGGTRVEAWMPLSAFRTHPSLAGLETQRYDAWVPGVQATELFSSRVEPYVPFTLRGFLWYQGEANVMNAEHLAYADKLRALITSWRQAWQDESLTFLFAQIAPFHYSSVKSWPKRLGPDALPALREAQVAALDQPHTGIIATTDLVANVKDIHPTNKRDVGRRFARLALATTYGRTTERAQSPQLAEVKHPLGSRSFIVILTPEGRLRSRDGLPLSHFQIAGRDRVFHPADARLRGDRVEVSSPLVQEPLAVRFGWDETADPNLVTEKGLPVLPFRTDDWPLVLEVPKTDPAP